jgi:hypothetical protein
MDEPVTLDALMPRRRLKKNTDVDELPDPTDKAPRPALDELARVYRDAEALELRAKHYTYDQIKDALDYDNVEQAREASRRASERLRLLHEDDQEAVTLELARYDAMARKLLEILERKHYVISNSGRVVEDPETGAPLIDSVAEMQVIDRLTTLSKERRKIQALDKPSTTRVEVHTVDEFDREIERLLGILADNTRPPRQLPPAPEPTVTAEQIVDAEVVEEATDSE